MAGSQRYEPGIESLALPAVVGVLLIAFGDLALDVLGSLLEGRFGNPLSLHDIQTAFVGEISTVALIAGVLFVFATGVAAEHVLKAGAAIYLASFVESVITRLLNESLHFGINTLIAPMYSVVFFLGFVLAFHLFFDDGALTG